VCPGRSAADGVEVVGVAGDAVLDLEDVGGVGHVPVAEEQADGPPDQLLVVHLPAELLAEPGG
jgi:hypothetical protein